MKDRFVQLVVQEKGNGDQDFRAFYYFEYYREGDWIRDEVRGYGKSIIEAVNDALIKYN